MKGRRGPVYGAKVTITGEGQAISGGALVGCAVRDGASPVTYAYVFQGTPYMVSGTPETTWSVTINGVDYSFPAADAGRSWTADPMDVAVLPITISGVESGESPGSLIYWPVAVDASGYIDAPTTGSSGVYHDVNQHYHSVEFRTTWTVPDFQTVFIWNSTDPFGGPYVPPAGVTRGVGGDDDVWVAGEKPPGEGGTTKTA